MRLTVAAALLALSSGPAHAAYVVDFGSGDRMTVDSYWEDGDRVHLMRDGVELTVPRARIRRLQQEEGSGGSPSTVKRAQPAPAKHQASRQELEARQRQVERHLLRVQQERFEARNRGEATERLGRELQHAQEKRRAVMQELERPAP